MKEYTKMNNENENLQQYVNVERSKWIEKEQELNKKINTKKIILREFSKRILREEEHGGLAGRGPTVGGLPSCQAYTPSS